VVAARPATKVTGFNAGTSREVTGARAAHQRTYDNVDDAVSEMGRHRIAGSRDPGYLRAA
jgi:hypothetical protein